MEPRRAALVATTVAASLGLGYRAVFGSRSQGFGPFPYAGRPVAARPQVALTFDDGPNEPHTSALLDTLAAEGAPATFFQVGRCAERHPDVTRRVVADGHVLANHSYSHAFGRYVTEPRQVEEVRRGREVLADLTGVVPALYRPPWLCHPPWVLATVRGSGATPVSGTFAHVLEVLQPPAALIAASAARKARPGAVLILHDGRESRGGPRGQTVAAVGPLVRRLRDRGVELVTVDRLLGVAAYA